MIKECEVPDIETVVKFIYNMNSIVEFEFDNCPHSYKDIKSMINHEFIKTDTRIIVSYDGKELNGVAILPCDDIVNDCVGIFAKSSFGLTVSHMLQFAENDLKGRSYFFCVNDKNHHINELVELYNITDLGKDITMKLDHTSLAYTRIECFDDKFTEYQHEFISLHNSLFPDVYWTGEKIQNTINNWIILLEFEHDILVGYIILSTKSDCIYVQAIGVKEDFRKKGYGHRLMKRAVVFASKKYKKIILEVEAVNKDAISLYQSIGFKIEKCKHLYKITF